MSETTSDTTLFDDTGSSETGVYTMAEGRVAAVSFSTGASDVTLDDIKLDLLDEFGDTGSIDVQVYADDGGAVGASIADLGSIDETNLSTTAALIDLTISGSPTLSANTTYWIGLATTDGSAPSVEFTNQATGTGVAGQQGSFNGALFSQALPLMAVTAMSLCFGSGTRILTARGEVTVDDLREGDQAMALRHGGPARVRWIGQRHVDLRAHPDPDAINPIRVRRHAFGHNLPYQDLILSPNHALYVNDHLIAVRYLLNGATIVQEAWDSITYFHVELDSHDVLLANGLPAESYLDVGNRGAFANGGEPLILHPDFGRKAWDADACAPDLPKGGELARVRLRLFERALSLGYATTSDPDMTLLAGSRRIHPRETPGGLVFDLPAAGGPVRLVSRSAAPSEMREVQSDGRRLGVGVQSIRLDDRALRLTDPRLTTGWHPAEAGLRWTDGDARVEAGAARSLTIRLHAAMTYWAHAPIGQELPFQERRRA